MMFLQNLPEPVRRRASLLSTSGKTFDDSQLAPLEFKVTLVNFVHDYKNLYLIEVTYQCLV